MGLQKQIKQALKTGNNQERGFGGAYSAHTMIRIQGDYGTLILSYLQGMLMNVWHVDSGNIWSVPLIFDKGSREYRITQQRFTKAARILIEKGEVL